MVKPKKSQLEFLEWGLGAFFHFGIRTFHEGHRDWDMKPMSLENFKPAELDCRQWINTVKSAGAKYAILVTKHHDGFANWPSKFTDYSVANTPWKGGKGDVVREFVDACREFHVKVGLYYSPAEFGSKENSGKDYDEYFINQISELLANYGTIDYLWFDGCGSEDHEYDTNRIIKEIRRLQPNILIFNMWDPDTRWVGNESGYAHSPNYNCESSLSVSVQTDAKDKLEKERFLPVECDIRMRRANWFYSDTDEDTVKTLDELIGIYYYSIGRSANLLINIGPDRRGLLPEKDSLRLIELGDEIKRRFSDPIEHTLTKNDHTYVCSLDNPQLMDHVVLQENMEGGNLIEKYIIKAYPYKYGDPINVYEGRTIGHKAICSFPAFYTNKIEITIEEMKENEEIKNILLYFSKEI